MFYNYIVVHDSEVEEFVWKKKGKKRETSDVHCARITTGKLY